MTEQEIRYGMKNPFEGMEQPECIMLEEGSAELEWIMKVIADTELHVES